MDRRAAAKSAGEAAGPGVPPLRVSPLSVVYTRSTAKRIIRLRECRHCGRRLEPTNSHRVRDTVDAREDHDAQRGCRHLRHAHVTTMHVSALCRDVSAARSETSRTDST